MWDLVLVVQPGQGGGVESPEQPVEHGSVGFGVEAFDVDQTAVAGGHHHRQPVPACGFPDQRLDIEGVALLDHDVEPLEESVDAVCGHAAIIYAHSEIRVDLGDPASCHRGFVDAEVEDRCRHPVEVRQLQRVEVGQSQLSTQSLHRQRVGDGMSDAEPDDSDPQ